MPLNMFNILLAETCAHSSCITPQLFISDRSTARNEEKVKELGITHIISLTPGCAPELPCIPANQRLHIELEDKDYVNILPFLQITTAFISAAIKSDPRNKVLVHCGLGVNRSPTVACAYLLATTDMDVYETIRYIKTLRKDSNPSYEFQQQLESYAVQFEKPKLEIDGAYRTCKKVVDT